MKNSVVVNCEADGGLKIPCVDVFVKAQKLGWIKRVVLNENAGWLELLKTCVPKMPIGHLLKCNIDPSELSNELPAFYRQVLYIWYSIQNDPTQPVDIQREYIWLNKLIRIDNQSLFNKNLFDAGVICINDILNAEGNFLTHKQFTEKFGVKISYMYYISLIDAIPQEWRKKLKRANINLDIVNTDELPHVKMTGGDRAVTLTSTREYYWKMMANIEGTPSCYKAWADRLGIEHSREDWQKIFMLPKQCVRDTRIIEMQYKILHRCYATESIICKWDSSVLSTCDKCQKKANILHNFYSCPDIKQFWCEIEDTVVDNLKLSPVNLSVSDVIFGRYVGVKNELLNHMLLHAKYYLHTTKIQNRSISIVHFKNYYKKMLDTEKERYAFINKERDFERIFGQVLFT